MQYSIKYKLEAGEILCVDNHRVLHGRMAYSITEDTQRHLEGGYIDWDEKRSKRRVLQKQLSKL